MSIPVLHLFKRQESDLSRLQRATLRDRITAQLIDGVILGVVIGLLLALYSRGELYAVWISPIIPVFLVQTVPHYTAHAVNWWWGGYFHTISFSFPLLSDVQLAYPAPIQYIIYIAYYGFFTGFRGQTPGKMMKGLVVLTPDKDAVTFGNSFLRWFGYLPSLIPLGAGFWLGELNPLKRGWHDRIAGTAVWKFLELEK